MDNVKDIINKAGEQLGLEMYIKPGLDDYDAGKALKHMGRYKEAIELFLNILQHNPNKESDFLSYRQIGDCYFDQEKYEGALLWYNRARSSRPGGEDDCSLDKSHQH